MLFPSEPVQSNLVQGRQDGAFTSEVPYLVSCKVLGYKVHPGTNDLTYWSGALVKKTERKLVEFFSLSNPFKVC